MSPKENLRKFVDFVQNAPTDEKAERFVRDFLSDYMWSCPIPLLVQLSQCAVDYRKEEMRNEAQLN